MTSMFDFQNYPVMAGPDANGPAGFTTQWHGHGDDHQDGNDPGDTAADRHNFGNGEAGKSGHNPTAGSNQDDFSEATGLPIVHHSNHASSDEDEEEDLDLDILI